MSLHERASQAHRRGHMDFFRYPEGAVNPYRPGSFAHHDWQAGHDDAANSAKWAAIREAEQTAQSNTPEE